MALCYYVSLFLLISIVFLTTTEAQTVAPRTVNSMRQMRQARQCLPYKVTNMTDRWLHYVRDRHHRAQLECITLEMLHSRLSSGESMCQAIKAALQRVTNFHRHVLDQRAAEGLSNIEGSGWDETMRLLYDAWEPVLPQCQQNLQLMSPDKLNPRTISECMSQHGFNAFEALTLDYFG